MERAEQSGQKKDRNYFLEKATILEKEAFEAGERNIAAIFGTLKVSLEQGHEQFLKELCIDFARQMVSTLKASRDGKTN